MSARPKMLRWVRYPLLDCLPGPLQRAVHRGERGVEDARDLGARELQHLAQDQDCALGAEMAEARRRRTFLPR
jgi:hypothetical protein